MRAALAALLVLTTGAEPPKAEAKGPPSDQRRVSTLPTHGAGRLVGRCEDPCPTGEQCVLLEVHCIKAPCPPIKRCLKP